MIFLDGSTGEGGGQILRSALSLSMITRQPFRITNIRGNRSKPGLLRQHLVAVQAAAQVCGADVGNVALGTTELEFIPGKIRGGHYNFAIGSAGSCNLVLQTLLPALLFADAPSQIRITGGTHNSKAPPVHFLQRAYVPQLAAMGAEIDIHLERFGFYPAGGGEVIAKVAPCAQLKPIELLERGKRKTAYAESFFAGIPADVAKRELECVGKSMGWDETQLLVRGLPDSQGPGNVLLMTLEFENLTEVFCAFGEKSVPAVSVARMAIGQARSYIASGAAIGEHLADQIMLPMALAGAGCFTTDSVSQHALTNAEVIAEFLPVQIDFVQHENFSTCTIRRTS